MSERVRVIVPEALQADLCDAGLRYVSDRQAGISRRRAGNRFVYRDATGRTVRDRATLARIKGLVIPPAWRDVWICPHGNGHIQATGRDERGRKQYRYHTRWNAHRSANKYDRLIEFAQTLPAIRRACARDLRAAGLPRAKVLAAVVQMMEQTLIRIGCEEYARTNESFGLATMRRRHVEVRSGVVRLRFRGKSGQSHDISVQDKRLVRIVRRCHDLPGHELFKYVDDDGNLCDVTSTDINAYIREIAGADFTAKDFRTWGGTVQAARALCALGYGETQQGHRAAMVEGIRQAALALGNRPATCRKHYIHPVVLEAFERRVILEALPGMRAAGAGRTSRTGLSADERAVLKMLKKSRRDAARGAAGEGALKRSLRLARRAKRATSPDRPKRAAASGRAKRAGNARRTGRTPTSG
jgi:DNA topoisomerase-1